VRQHLQDVLSSAAFSGSKRAQEFLQLVVEHALADRTDSLKERMIGAEMFGRPVDYDTANDAVVRVKATEVRRRILQYYRDSTPDPPVRIDIPVGSYVPKFAWHTGKASAPPSATPALLEGQTARDAHPAASAPVSARRSWRNWKVLVPLAVLFALALLFAVQSWWGISSASPIRSLAILPFVNLSGDPRQEYFADGMTEELIAELGQVSTLRVISRTSAMTYKSTKKTVPVIARELHVDGILEGPIEREGNKVRVIIQLIDSRTDEHIWAHSYERDMTSALELQGEVARAITDQVRIELTPQQEAHLKRSRRAEPAALELHLQGMQRLNSGNPRAAIELFRQAIEEDPDYAPAHAAMAGAYGWMGEAGWISYAEAFAQQKAAAQKAIELDDSRPEPHLELGFAAMNQDWDWATQNKEFRRALELNPNSAAVHWAYANYFNRVGLANDAVAEAKVALQLDPVSSRSYMNLSFVYYYARQYDEALVQIERAVAMHPDPLETAYPLSIIYVEKRQYDKAIHEFQKMGDAPHGLGHLGNAYARRGLKSEARAVVPKLKEHVDKTGVGRYEIALVYAGLQENDKAFEWLESAFQVRDKGLTYLKVDPCLDSLRSDERFTPLLQRVGIPTS
ncbi:MAG TPA: tetratricopeptide repeat protein, partial [Candidatus Acidoferrum sp.]|nr:tetratricopeptide repeat protein [Candidatus Acidoferrum sp.]